MLSVQGIAKTYLRDRRGDRSVTALEGVDVEVGRGEFVTIVGPSGCGKSTLLRIVGGFEPPTEGGVRLDDVVVEAPGRDRGMVFQQPALFPWRTALDNVGYALETGGLRRRQARERAAELLNAVGLHGADHGAYPAELSGGMLQRVALARALALDPAVLLMDEPFAALDAQAREQLQLELHRIWRRAATALTVLFVTHDLAEAVLLGTRVLVMSSRPGRIVADRRVPLPVDRDVTTTSTPQFLLLRDELRALLRSEGP